MLSNRDYSRHNQATVLECKVVAIDFDCTCPKCGEKRVVKTTDNTSDTVTCHKCGHEFTY